MNPVREADVRSVLSAQAKHTSLTNYAFDIESYELFARHTALFLIEAGDDCYLLKKREMGYNLTFFLRSFSPMPMPKSTFIEVFAREENNYEHIREFFSATFHARRVRLARTAVKDVILNEKIRPMAQPDFVQVHSLLMDCFVQTPEYIPKIWELEAMKDAVCIHDEGKVIAFMQTNNRPLSAELRLLAVHGDFRGRGYGKMLVEGFLSKHQKKVSIWVDPNNTAAVRLYESYGFAADGLGSWVIIIR